MKALRTTEGNVQIAWAAPRWASSGLTGPLIIPDSEAGHAGELELAHAHRGHDDGVAAVVEQRRLGVAPEAFGAGEHVEHVLVEAQIADAARHPAVLDQERAVARHAGDD